MDTAVCPTGTILPSRLPDGSDLNRVLIIEDDPICAQMLASELQGPHRQIFYASTVRGAERALARGDFALILLDLILPDGDGRNILIRLCERFRQDDCLIIVLSTMNSSKAQTECFSLGADMYFNKPVDPVILQAAVTAKLQQRSERQKYLRQDPLTGQDNRTSLFDHYERCQRMALRSQAPFSLALLDLDHFKRINDHHGHTVGDEVLRRSAHVIAQTLRASDILARWGGDEFVVLFPNTIASHAAWAMKKAQAVLRSERFCDSHGRCCHITFSAGVVQPLLYTTLEENITKADHSLYQAKTQGRNRILWK